MRWLVSCDMQGMMKVILTHHSNGAVELRHRSWVPPSSSNQWFEYPPTLGMWVCISWLCERILWINFPRRATRGSYVEWWHGQHRYHPLHPIGWKPSRKGVVGRRLTPTLDHHHSVSWPQAPEKKRLRKVCVRKLNEIATFINPRKTQNLKYERWKYGQ